VNTKLNYSAVSLHSHSVAYPGILFVRFQKIQLRAEVRENGDLGAVAP